MKEPNAAECGEEDVLGDYRTEQVASIAARLLQGDRYAEAAERAIQLLDACRNKLSTRQRQDFILSHAQAERKQWWDKYVLTKNGKTYAMTWREALYHITGQRKEERAQPRFVKFYAFYWQNCDAIEKSVAFETATVPTAREIADRIRKFKSEGFNSHRAGVLKAAFEEWSKLDSSSRAKSRVEAREIKKAAADRAGSRKSA